MEMVPRSWKVLSQEEKEGKKGWQKEEEVMTSLMIYLTITT